MHEARFWEKAENNQVRCRLCRFYCRIPDGARGRCEVRENRGGILYSLVYGKCVAEHSDPVEKKPLFHYHPGSRSYSLATVGCNFRCLHCQNAEIAQWQARRAIPGQDLAPDTIVERALAGGCRSIAYTYTEPTIYFEYAYDIAVLAREAGLGNLFVTNGYTAPAPLEAIAPLLDAANVDLKGFSDNFYREITGARLAGVLETLKHYRRLGIWLEITTLIIPGLNDSDTELTQAARFIAEELGPHTPWHVTAFHPYWRMTDRPPTPTATLHRAAAIGRQAGLLYVYEGNVPDAGEDTCCPQCGRVLVSRRNLHLHSNHLVDGKCPDCRTKLHGIGMDTL